MKTFLLPLLALSILFASGCDPDAAGNILGGVDEPTVTYSETNLEATFFAPGNSPTPSISWNGDQGTISLSGEPTGMTVNSTNGNISWDHTLPVGTHDFDVVVGNSEGQVVIPMTIANPLSGEFDGTYAGAYPFKFDVRANGDIVITADGTTASGTWTVTDGDFIAYYEYDDYPGVDYTVLGDINQSGSVATIVGDYYNGRYEDGDSPVNEFEVTLQ